jgi:hypothetical protein
MIQKGATSNKTRKKGQKRTKKVPRGDPKPDLETLETVGEYYSKKDDHLVIKKKPMPPIKQKGTLSHTTRKVLKAMECGIPAKEAYETIVGKTPSETTVYDLGKKLEQKRLSDPDFVAAAQTALMRALKGKVICRTDSEGEVHKIVPGYSHMLTAATMVMDRAEPAIKHSVQVTATVSPVDLSKYRLDGPVSEAIASAQQDIIDALPEPLESDDE